MIPIHFPQANTTFGPPPDLTDEQCGTVHAYRGTVERGSVEGTPHVIVAWKPDKLDLEAINRGEPIFIAMLGGLAPHMLTTSFESAKNPA